METTTIEIRTDASIVYELLLRAGYRGPATPSFPAPYEQRYYCPNSDVLALHQDWTRRYSTGQDTPR